MINKGCCLFKSSVRTPSFASSKKSFSRASAIVYENRSDIISIRRVDSSWRDDDDRSIEDSFSQATRSSLDVNVGSLKSAKSDENHIRKKKHDEIILETCISNRFEDRISPWVYNSAKENLNMDSFYKRSPYHMQQKNERSTNKFLSLLTMCLWKCSTGCQDISELNNN